MNHQKLILSVLLSLVIFSCKKKDKSELISGPPTYNYFTQLKVGNYWVYAQYKKHAFTGDESDFSTDSVYVSKDTTINGQQYFICRGTNSIFSGSPYQEYLKDSTGYIVDHLGYIVEYPIKNYTDTVYKEIYPDESQPIYSISAKWSDPNLSVSAPAGTFSTSNLKVTLSSLIPPEITLYINNYFTYSIGLIKSSGTDVEDPIYNRIRELKAYHIN